MKNESCGSVTRESVRKISAASGAAYVAAKRKAKISTYHKWRRNVGISKKKKAKLTL